MSGFGVKFDVFGNVGVVCLSGAECCLDLEWSGPLCPKAGKAFLVESRCPLLCVSLDRDLLRLLDLDLLEDFFSLVKGDLKLFLDGGSC